METLYYFNYNNYVNRIVKGYATLNEYIQNGTLLGSTNKASFNKLSEKEAEATFICEKSPDYCIAVDKYGDIESRWFVIDEQRKNYTNLKLNLKRDLVFDNLKIIVENPNTLVERGFPNGTSDGSILNKEDFNFNAYKQLELPIEFTDTAQNRWVALFIGNSINSKVSDNPTTELYITNSANTDTYYDNTDISLKGKFGYNILLVPYEVFLDEYYNYGIKTDNLNNPTSNITIHSNPETVTNIHTCASIRTAITESLLPNEAIIDIQVIPDYIVGIDYTIDDVNKVITINATSQLEQTGNMIFYRKVSTTVACSCFYFTGNVIQETAKTFTLGDLGLYPDADEGIMAIKKLERYKVYIQSPDRSSNVEIDLKKYFKGSSSITNTSNITFNITCKFQPYQSFIYISPDNVGYFGCNTQDGEYLICGYNNQMLRTTDAWLSFLLNNKNYLNSFNLEMRDSYINTATGALTGAISGATTGALVGGGAVGAVIGGAVGGTASLIQGLVNTEEKRKQFEWSIDNIKSKPQSVAKVASFVNINSIYPTIRVCYNSQDNFDEYLKLNNCKISKIGPINNYVYPTEYPLYTYVVADLIKLEAFNGTADELLEIQNELKRGLYFEVKSI